MFSRTRHNRTTPGSRYTLPTKEELEKLNEAAKHAAFSGDCKLAESYRRQGASLNSIARAVGISGNWPYAEFLLRQNPQSNMLLNELAVGFSMNGNHSAARRLMARGADVNAVLFGSAFHGGDKEWTMNLLHDHVRVDIIYIFIGAISGGHLEWVEKLRTRDENFYPLHQVSLRHCLSLAAREAGFEEYAKFLQGKNLTVFPSDTPAYAELTSQLATDAAFFSPYHQSDPVSQKTPLEAKPPQTKHTSRYSRRNAICQSDDSKNFLPPITTKRITAKQSPPLPNTNNGRRDALIDERHAALFLPQLETRKKETHQLKSVSSDSSDDTFTLDSSQ